MYKSTIALVYIVLLSGIVKGQVDYTAQRENMVKTQLQARGINDPETIRAMHDVERHEFVPQHIKKYEYTDSA